jgi:hypothetical protein
MPAFYELLFLVLLAADRQQGCTGHPRQALYEFKIINSFFYMTKERANILSCNAGLTIGTMIPNRSHGPHGALHMVASCC